MGAYMKGYVATALHAGRLWLEFRRRDAEIRFIEPALMAATTDKNAFTRHLQKIPRKHVGLLYRRLDHEARRMRLGASESGMLDHVEWARETARSRLSSADISAAET